MRTERLVAGGAFAAADGNTSANYVAEWNGSAWAPLGTGMDFRVFALAVYRGMLVAGGWFTTAGGVAASRIAQWDGSAWSPLGSGMSENSTVYALATFQDRLIVGGVFTTAGGVAASCIAQWDGARWAAMGAGVWLSYAGEANVRALTVYNGMLIAAGRFDRVDAMSAHSIARWDGVVWSVFVPDLFGGSFYAMCVHGTRLLAGGPGGIVQWNGTAWSALGQPTTSYNVNTLTTGSVAAARFAAVDRGGDYNDGELLYAGGPGGIGDVQLHVRIAQWNGTAWSPLGSGISDLIIFHTVNVILARNNAVVAGGLFATAGGVAANCIAQWNGTAWAPLGHGLNDSVYALVAYTPPAAAAASDMVAGWVVAISVVLVVVTVLFGAAVLYWRTKKRAAKEEAAPLTLTTDFSTQTVQ